MSVKTTVNKPEVFELSKALAKWGRVPKAAVVIDNEIIKNWKRLPAFGFRFAGTKWNEERKPQVYKCIYRYKKKKELKTEFYRSMFTGNS